jgi:hypothetical protein
MMGINKDKSPIVERFGESSQAPSLLLPPISNDGIMNGIIGSEWCHTRTSSGPLQITGFAAMTI